MHDEVKHVVVLIHGIRDWGLWEAKVSAKLADNGFEPVTMSYGRFGLFSFLAPVSLFRNRAIASIEKRFDEVLHDHPHALISVIAHSFGTYIFAHLLQRMQRLKIHRIIFCGSVLHRDFPFEQLINRFQVPILNEVGTRDIFPALAESVTWGYGSAGTYGFIRPRIRDRWHNGAGHGYFFQDGFFEDFWLKFLKNGTFEPGDLPPEEPRWWVKFISIFKIKYLLMILLILGITALGCNLFNRSSPHTVVLVDSRLLDNIYDDHTKIEGGTNNNDIVHALRNGPIPMEFEMNLFGTLVYPNWADDSQIFALKPDVVILHINAFTDATQNNKSHERISEFIKGLQPGTDVVVYSRGFDRGTEEASKQYLSEVLNLDKDQTNHLHIEALREGVKTFRDSGNATHIRRTVADVLRRRGSIRAGTPWCCFQ